MSSRAVLCSGNFRPDSMVDYTPLKMCLSSIRALRVLGLHEQDTAVAKAEIFHRLGEEISSLQRDLSSKVESRS